MKLYETLEKQLKKETNYFTDNGELKKWVVLNKAQNFDEELIGLLLDNADLKDKFFVNVKGTLVFNQNLFVQFLEQKNYLNDSYTQYKNKVGLTIDGKYLKQRNEVALVWPFRDCILEGGQSREEDKREEIFFNEILAQDEITQLLEPKVLTNAKRIDKDGEKPLDKFNRDDEGVITDNLIIKGNNLLALHTLKNEFAGKVKLIYIDPPYNTGGLGDTFTYNNNFKRSTWLTFMYNRLIAAKELLRKDGILIVAIDENEQPHLGVMLKEFFKDYEVHCITIVHNPRGVQGTNFSYTHEYAFFVVPKGKKLIGNRIIDEREIDFSNLRNWGGESLRSDAKNCFYPIVVDPKTSEIIEFGEVCEDDFHPSKREIIKDGKVYIYPIDNDNIERKWRYARQSVEEIRDLLRARKKSGQWDVEIGKNFGQYKTVWIDPKYDANEYGTKIVSRLVPENKFSFPKSLYNVKDCVYAVVGNDKDAIVLDYHAGSGTTAHAVLELNKEDGGNRKFILCEQMDYVETVTSKRVQRVIEQNGSDEFIYLELKKYNQTFIEQIESAKDTKALLKIWEQMKEKSFLNYNVDLQKQEQHIDEFKALTLAEQKQHLVELLDKNQLYVNLSSLNDADFACTEDEKKVTQDFYQIKK
ncbi:MAG: site-specific DNA-methyltransferase [Bacteroidetes bacterium]|jgi:adenine-specific DNA-methyltransferase|nr:site-specific DNA-methyltransferase [Bacteroidota bacterium]